MNDPTLIGKDLRRASPSHTVQCGTRIACARRMRRVAISILLLGFLAGSAYDIVADEEHWPFSQYPMFSGVWQSPTFSWLRLYGVSAADGHEFALDANRYVSPFDQSRLPKVLRRMLERQDGLARIHQALGDLAARYETLRQHGVHEGPRIATLRLYEVEWTIDRHAANVEHPDYRRLIDEVQR